MKIDSIEQLQTYAGICEQHLAAMRDVLEKAHALEERYTEQLRQAFPGCDRIWRRYALSTPVEKEFRHEVERVFRELVDGAGSSRNVAYRAELPLQEVRAHFFPDNDLLDKSMAFRPMELVEWLLQQYGEEKCAQLALSAAADELFKLFLAYPSTNADQAPRKTRSACIFAVRVITSRFTYSHHSWDTLHNLARSMGTFGTWAEVDNPQDWEKAISDISAGVCDGRDIKSRLRCDLGSGLSLVFYKSRIDCVFSHSLARKLQKFLALHRERDAA